MIRQKIRNCIKNNKRLVRWLLGKFVKLHNYSYHKITEYANYLNNNIHPKHEITNYHQFFIDRIEADDVVLDFGCGIGYLAFDMASKAKQVFGVDISSNNIKYAQEHYQRVNLKFVVADATQYNFDTKFDKIALSNVLEHIKDRVGLLQKLNNISDTILLRVPMINRDWLTVYKKNMGFEYRLDDTHYIEYTLESIQDELNQSGWGLDYYQVNWGELWAVLKAKK